MEVKDNPYIVYLALDEFDELLSSSYENFVEWGKKEMAEVQLALAARVLEKLHKADAEHVCLDGVDAPEWSKEFSITSVTKADLIAAGFAEAVVKQLTDVEMHEIASAMEDVYCDHGYWEDVELCTKRILERKEEAVGEQQNQQAGSEDGLTCME